MFSAFLTLVNQQTKSFLFSLFYIIKRFVPSKIRQERLCFYLMWLITPGKSFLINIIYMNVQKAYQI